jgi:hypothetical protein
MVVQERRLVPGISVPSYLRRVILFDKLISGAVVAITIAIGASLLFAAACNQFSLWFIAGIALLFIIGVALSM